MTQLSKCFATIRLMKEVYKIYQTGHRKATYLHRAEAFKVLLCRYFRNSYTRQFGLQSNFNRRTQIRSKFSFCVYAIYQHEFAVKRAQINVIAPFLRECNWRYRVHKECLKSIKVFTMSKIYMRRQIVY